MKSTLLKNRLFFSIYSILIFAESSSLGQVAKPQDLSNSRYLSKPLITALYTADPSAHVFNKTIYIYPSHDVEAGIKENDFGDHFDMKDYHVLSMNNIGEPVTDHGIALDVKDVAWAKRQMWAPDAAYKNGTYYLYFPAKDAIGKFFIGLATSKSPVGPFIAQPAPIQGSFSTDPAVFTDDDGKSFMYFGGLWGGQLEKWQSGKFDSSSGQEPNRLEFALSPKVAKLTNNMLEFDGAPQDVKIVDKDGKPLMAGDHERRFFEGSLMHKYKGKYYFSYSTGDTHYIAYAIGNNPMGPFYYQGIILNPVQGWTSHPSIIETGEKWYIFYHDTQLSGKTHLRNIKVAELNYRSDGTIIPITPYQ